MNGAASAQSWPKGLPHRATYSISAVLDALTGEFPDLTISKLRYLEDQGLLAPERTASGYRRYSEADIERVAWVLIQQRDHFWPLRVIRARLAEMDAAVGPYALAMPRRPRPAPIDAEDVATVTGQDRAAVEAVAKAAGVDAKSADAALIQAVEAVADLAPFGLELRHLAPVFHAAQRQVELVALATSAAVGSAPDCAEAMARLVSALVRLKSANL
ncbi:MAG: MerR family DNA-binding transcriptional regulator [Bifidobacteriaceae bacterium]|nr:MerR family DNA-binding transcriptional regulator [Bifidobacteriaceae bacterium]